MLQQRRDESKHAEVNGTGRSTEHETKQNMLQPRRDKVQ